MVKESDLFMGKKRQANKPNSTVSAFLRESTVENVGLHFLDISFITGV